MFSAPAGTYVLEESRVIVDPNNQFHRLFRSQYLRALVHMILKDLRFLFTEILEFDQQGMGLLQVVAQRSDFFALVEDLPSLLWCYIEFFD